MTLLDNVISETHRAHDNWNPRELCRMTKLKPPSPMFWCWSAWLEKRRMRFLKEYGFDNAGAKAREIWYRENARLTPNSETEQRS